MSTAISDSFHRLGVEWHPEPAWYEYKAPFDHWFEEWFATQATWLWEQGWALETEWDAFGRFRIRAQGREAWA